MLALSLYSTTQLLNSLFVMFVLCVSPCSVVLLVLISTCISLLVYSLTTVYSIYESCCYHILTTMPPSSPNLQLNSICYVTLRGYSLYTYYISSSSIFPFWILVHTWRVQRDPLAAAASRTPPEDTTILSSLIQNILMTFIENCFGLLFVVTNSTTMNEDTHAAHERGRSGTSE